MPSPGELYLYPVVLEWLRAMGLTTHPVALVAVSHLVTALLVGQSLRPSALARALVSPQGVPARQRYKRVARCWDRKWLSPAWLSPRLVRAALALVPPDPMGTRTAGLTHLALDSVRCGPWEVFTVGVVWCGRVVPVGWAVLPYPWPKRRFTPTVCALLVQVAATWPATRPAHLVADRAFGSRAVLDTVRAVDWGFTLRLRAGHTVTVGGQLHVVRDRVRQARLGAWTSTVAQYGPEGARGSQGGGGKTAPSGQLVVGRGLVVLPWHQRDAGSARQRAQQHARRQRHLAGKHPGQAPDASCETAAWVVLFSSHSSWRGALDSYRRRWATEGSYRDAQGGWDGRHGWDLEPVLTRLHCPLHVERVVGLWALGSLVQTYVGQRVAQPTTPAVVQRVVRQWTTTGRLSPWARGHFALTDPSGALRPWLSATLITGATRLRYVDAACSRTHSTHAPPRTHSSTRTSLPCAA
jgi:hypothetical protein